MEAPENGRGVIVQKTKRWYNQYTYSYALLPKKGSCKACALRAQGTQSKADNDIETV